MQEANVDRTALSDLDQIVVRTALVDARKLISRGLTPAEAAESACRGAWRPLREAVLAELVCPGKPGVAPRRLSWVLAGAVIGCLSLALWLMAGVVVYFLS